MRTMSSARSIAGIQTTVTAERPTRLRAPVATCSWSPARHAMTSVRRPADFKTLFIPPAVVVQAASENGIPQTPHFRIPQDNDPMFFRALMELHAAIHRSETALEQQSWFAVCLRYVFDYYVERTVPAPRVANEVLALERARAVLQERYNEAVSLDELSAVAGLSRFHLLRAGVQETLWSTTPRIPDRHPHLARAGLQRGISAAEAAAFVGFADQSHFTRHFKRIQGPEGTRQPLRKTCCAGPARCSAGPNGPAPPRSLTKCSSSAAFILPLRAHQ